MPRRCGRCSPRRGCRPSAIDVVGFHGQTVLHRPEQRRTLQIGDGAAARRRAAAFRWSTDFRTADVAAGGQGAPLVPLYHAALAEALARPLAVLNIGGVANVTWIGGRRRAARCSPSTPAPATR